MRSPRQGWESAKPSLHTLCIHAETASTKTRSNGGPILVFILSLSQHPNPNPDPMEAQISLAYFFHCFDVELAEPTREHATTARHRESFLGENRGTMGPGRPLGALDAARATASQARSWLRGPRLPGGALARQWRVATRSGPLQLPRLGSPFAAGNGRAARFMASSFFLLC